MTWWMIVLLVLAVLFLIGCIPVGVDAAYRETGLAVDLKIGPVGLQLLPKKGKKKKKKKEEKPKEKGKGKSAILSGGLEGLQALLELLVETLGDLRRKLVINELTMTVTLGGKDAAAAACGYGKAWAVIGGITPVLDNLFVVKKRDIHPVLDYNETSIKFEARILLTITIGRALDLLLTAGLKFLKIMKENKKAVQKHESSTL
jgi:hypothetical protein